MIPYQEVFLTWRVKGCDFAPRHQSHSHLCRLCRLEMTNCQKAKVAFKIVWSDRQIQWKPLKIILTLNLWGGRVSVWFSLSSDSWQLALVLLQKFLPLGYPYIHLEREKTHLFLDRFHSIFHKLYQTYTTTRYLNFSTILLILMF